jgi:hypothetical protein
MLKLPAIETDEMLKKMTSEAVRRGEEVRATVRDLTLRSLQGRDVTLTQIKGALKSVTEGVNMGVASSAVDAERLLAEALAGMDDALLKAVEANRSVLQQVTGGDVSFEQSKMKKALDELERYEDTMFRTVKQASSGAGDRLRSQWESVLGNLKMQGTDTGERAAATLQEYGSQFQNAMRSSRTAATKVAHAMQSSYATLVGSALSGMSEALKQGGRGRSSVSRSGTAGGASSGTSSGGSGGGSGGSATTGSGGSSGSSGSGSSGSAASSSSRSAAGSSGSSGSSRSSATTTGARKTAAKKTAAKKTAGKKTAGKKTAAKKTPASTTAGKKTTARKTPAKKTAAKRT